MKFKPGGFPITSRALFTIVGGAVLINPVFAQDQSSEEIDEVVVTGIRGSLKASMNMKREAVGVVDAINAEDIGKFPDTNLAESLQRITGVSIDRVNGEGSRITARGFGPGFNLITLNGRTMPTADVVVVGSGGDGEYNAFTSRAFDMSNLASEGVSGLEVFKTGRAGVSTGGIGATINVKTVRPLESPGLKASVGVKAMYDTSVETGDSVTPEVSGLFSWTDESEKFGVAFFGSFQKRDSAAVGASNQDWNVEHLSSFLNTGGGKVDANTIINNMPAGDPLVVFPNNSDYFFSEVERERTNGQLTVQFAPTDSLTLTADAMFVQNDSTEERSTQGNWFNRPFAEVTFDDNPTVASVTFLRESLSAPKDIAWGQQLRATRDKLQSFGLNAAWKTSDRFSLVFDAATSKSESLPNGPGGKTSYDFGTGAASIASHSLTLANGFPVQNFIYDDQNQNDNGIIDIGDVSSSVGRTAEQVQRQNLDEFRLEGTFSLNDASKVTAGADHRTSEMVQRRFVTQQILGNWGVSNPGDIESQAPGVLEAYCLSCLYDDFKPGLGTTAFRGNAAQLYNALSPFYVGANPIGVNNNDFNTVDEDITAVFAEYAWQGEIGGHKANIVAGVRYEQTDVSTLSVVAVPNGINWVADNDFSPDFSQGLTTTLTDSADYSHVLPSFDFSIEPIDNVIVRASYSKTIGRADFGSLFSATTAGTPPRAIALGGIATGNGGNAGLVPLESENFDLSLELYYGDASYISLGFFDKKVDNFIGIGQFNENLFDLHDPSSGAPGTLSAQASTIIASIPGAARNDVNLAVITTMLQHPGANAEFADPRAAFINHSTGGVLNQTYADSIFSANGVNNPAFTQNLDITANNAVDPLFLFSVSRPINQEKANIHGVEMAFQHFFGESGFGIQGNYTVVDGDVGINVAADPGANQFALEGLSDTANATLIYEKFGFSARLAWNWRDRFLQQASRGGYRNPVFVSPFEEWDLNVSYDVNENIAVSLEAINLTGENVRTYGRSENDYWFAQDLHPRYLIGARYKF